MDSNDDSDDEEVTLNNNANRVEKLQPGTSTDYSLNEFRILPRDKEQELKDEEAGMQRFVEYIKNTTLCM